LVRQAKKLTRVPSVLGAATLTIPLLQVVFAALLKLQFRVD
jgi:hypothetical protein